MRQKEIEGKETQIKCVQRLCFRGAESVTALKRKGFSLETNSQARNIHHKNYAGPHGICRFFIFLMLFANAFFFFFKKRKMPEKFSCGNEYEYDQLIKGAL